jgi:hypothetical protein
MYGVFHQGWGRGVVISVLTSLTGHRIISPVCANASEVNILLIDDFQLNPIVKIIAMTIKR